VTGRTLEEDSLARACSLALYADDVFAGKQGFSVFRKDEVHVPTRTFGGC
jgi:hypothetical protein